MHATCRRSQIFPYRVALAAALAFSLCSACSSEKRFEQVGQDAQNPEPGEMQERKQTQDIKRLDEPEEPSSQPNASPKKNVFRREDWVREEKLVVKPKLSIVIDDSWSMAHKDLYDQEKAERVQRVLKATNTKGMSRLSLAKALLLQDEGQPLKLLAESYDVTLYRAGDQLQAIGDLRGMVGADEALSTLRTLAPRGEETRLGENLRQVLSRQDDNSTILLLSDGLLTAGPSLDAALESASERGTKIHVIAFGLETKPGVTIEDVFHPRRLVLGEEAKFLAVIRPDLQSSETVTILLRCDRDNEAVAAKTIQASQEICRVELSDRPQHPGSTNYAVVVGRGSEQSFKTHDRYDFKVDVDDPSDPPVASIVAVILERDHYKLSDDIRLFVTASGEDNPKPTSVVVQDEMGNTQVVPIKPSEDGRSAVAFKSTEGGRFSIHAEDESGRQISATERFEVTPPADGTDGGRDFNHILLNQLAEETAGSFRKFSLSSWSEVVTIAVEQAPKTKVLSLPESPR